MFTDHRFQLVEFRIHRIFQRLMAFRPSDSFFMAGPDFFYGYVVVICGEQKSLPLGAHHLHIPIGAHHQFWMVLGQFFPTFSNHEVYSHVGSHVALSENRVSNFFTMWVNQ